MVDENLLLCENWQCTSVGRHEGESWSEDKTLFGEAENTMNKSKDKSAASGTAVQGRTYDVVYAGLFAVLIAVCAWISIPAAVPFTLQTFGVFMAVGVLGGKRGTLAVLAYILLGAVGAPVFAGFTGGIGILLGNTGGYIVGFFFSALVMWALEKIPGRGRAAHALAMLAGLAVCYLFGTVWFMVVYSRANGPVSAGTVLGWCVIPFIIPDLLKIALACILAPKIKRGMGPDPMNKL